jgi:outer membrane protein TolC
LNYVCGIEDTTLVELSNPDILLLPPSSFENTLQASQFRLDSLKLLNRDAQVDYAYRPKLDVFADAGFNSSLTYRPYKNFGASVGLSLVAPIYDGNQRQKQHDKIRISELVRQNYREFAQKQYQQQIRQLYQQLQQTDAIIQQAQEVVRYTQALMEAHGKLLQTGNASITDYVLAINNFLNARHAVLQNTNNRMQIINQLNYWNYER